MNLTIGKGFVRISVGLITKGILIIFTTPEPISSLIKCSLTSICFVLSCSFGFLLNCIALELTQLMEIDSCLNPNSDAKPMSHFVSFVASMSATYSTSVLDKATTDYSDSFQRIAPSYNVKTNPVTDLLLSKLPAKSEAT